ncbi:ParB N-terminal domain-containing protein [Peptostreptococcus sp. D1]|uniref:ParB N-terminal domain-containing protein n=1 Tax=Peptostreptococcus sp. D1 TaxID=72304 RepID=UPI001FA8F379|nr:ParB N-terminal domain-containing protein [Peptostreptococcus sp. D1]
MKGRIDMSEDIKILATQAKLVSIDDVYANDYNPNIVAAPEMKLLELSIRENGFCYPIIVIQDNNKYCIVDGFHRYTVAKRLNLKEIPVVILEHDIVKRISATVQFNRARGTHQVLDMSKIVIRLIEEGKGDDEIAEALGMEEDEVFRLKQLSGLKEAFKDKNFSNSWEEFTKKYKWD